MDGPHVAGPIDRVLFVGVELRVVGVLVSRECVSCVVDSRERRDECVLVVRVCDDGEREPRDGIGLVFDRLQREEEVDIAAAEVAYEPSAGDAESAGELELLSDSTANAFFAAATSWAGIHSLRLKMTSPMVRRDSGLMLLSSFRH